jgi:ABC-type uncharacterized transport system auxiliary subunit
MKMPSAPHNARPALGCLLLVMTLALAGCLSKPALRRQTFALQNPSVTTAPAKGSGVLVIRTCVVSPTFTGRSLVYRTGQDSYELDPYAGFLVQPGQALAVPLRGYLRNSGVFADVVETDGPIAPDRLLDIYVSELYGDFRSSARPAAVLSLGMRFFLIENDKPAKVLLQKDYSRSIPLKQNTAAAVVAGWDEALAEIMAAVAADLKAIR